MKMPMCDICLKEDQLTKAKFRCGWNGGLKVDLCEDHKNYLEGKSEDQIASEVFNGKITKIKIGK